MAKHKKTTLKKEELKLDKKKPKKIKKRIWNYFFPRKYISPLSFNKDTYFYY